MALLGRRRRERTIYFPWERRGILRALQLPQRRARGWLLVAVAVAFLFWLDARNRRERLVRTTRAALEQTRQAVDAYRADHDGRCPRDLGELTAPADHTPYVASVPVDAWHTPLRYVCPGRVVAHPYDLLSDGPDREPYGLDRIE